MPSYRFACALSEVKAREVVFHEGLAAEGLYVAVAANSRKHASQAAMIS